MIPDKQSRAFGRGFNRAAPVRRRLSRCDCTNQMAVVCPMTTEPERSLFRGISAGHCFCKGCRGVALRRLFLNLGGDGGNALGPVDERPKSSVPKDRQINRLLAHPKAQNDDVNTEQYTIRHEEAQEG
jgi:hypothetical protein